MDRINDRLDKLFSKISSIDATLASQHENLKEHMRRTDLLERKMDVVEKQNSMWTGAIKVITSGAVLGAIIKLLSH